MANSAKDIQMRELRDTIAQLNELVKTLQETLKQVNALNTQVTQERDNLKEQVDYLTKKLFGTSSEKRSHNIPVIKVSGLKKYIWMSLMTRKPALSAVLR